MRVTSPCPFPTRRRQTGSALVLTLFLVAIAALIVVSLLAFTSTDRVAAGNYAKSLQAEQIGQGGLSLVVAELQQEMARSGSPINVGGVSVYTNITSANVLPQQVGAAGYMTNLVKVSTNAPFFASAIGGLTASSVNSTTSNAQTRAVSLAKWNGSYLGAFTNTTDAPSWVYVTRSGPTNAAGLTFGVSGNTLNNTNPGNTNYALGRFAYAIYDEGGLLDITLAGYPSTNLTSNLSAADLSRKGAEALADLTQIPGLTSQSTVDALVAWRNSASIASSYTNYLFNVAPTNGYLQVYPGDNTFLSRADLIAYAQANNITNALPYLTTFSRELNSPSIPAGANSTLNPDFRALIFNGQPLQRFPLSLFQLLDQNPSALSTADASTISTYFGLTPSSGASATWRSWQYPTTNIGTPQTAIAAGRTPNVFELVKAAIVYGSLGSYLQNNGVIFSTTTGKSGNPYPPEQNVDQQVARIIANMIDQVGTDNYPTTIQMGTNTIGNTVYGIKNLPYFSEMFLKVYFPSATFNNAAGAGADIYFELWNPHESPVPSVGPTQVRVVINSQAQYTFNYIQQPSDIQQSVYSPNVYQSFPSYGVNIGALTNYYQPSVIVNSSDTNSYRTNMAIGSNPTGFNSFRLNPFNVSMTNSFNNGSPNVINLITMAITPVLQYQDGGIWRTYSTFAGYADDGGATGMQNNSFWIGGAAALATNQVGNASQVCFNNRIDQPNCSIPKPDPRTFRFRSGWSESLSPPGQITFNSAMVSAADLGQVLVQYQSGGFPTPYNPGMLYRNNGTGNPIVSDPDGTGRVGDGYLSSTTNSANPMQTNSSARPIILNRPFRSVGELGYVFRDSPWKSLNFFSTDSGDAALLDLFSLENSPMTAAKVSLNTRHIEVLEALLNGAMADETGGAPPLTQSQVTQIASDIVAATSAHPFDNRSALVGQFSTAAVNTNYPAIKARREAPIRALASETQTRTWNLMIDLVAQSGRFTPTSTSLAQFTVSAERHYWLHVAIDRVTGQVIDSKLETINP